MCAILRVDLFFSDGPKPIPLADTSGCPAGRGRRRRRTTPGDDVGGRASAGRAHARPRAPPRACGRASHCRCARLSAAGGRANADQVRRGRARPVDAGKTGRGPPPLGHWSGAVSPKLATGVVPSKGGAARLVVGRLRSLQRPP